MEIVAILQGRLVPNCNPKELCATTGRAPEELVDAMVGYLAELAQTGKMLDDRYDEIKSGQVKPIDGQEAFNRIRSKSCTPWSPQSPRHRRVLTGKGLN